MMVAAIGLAGVLVGAFLTATAQLRVRRSERSERWLGDLLQNCAEVYALESTFRWDAMQVAKQGGREASDRLRTVGLDAWPLMDRRVAEAKIMLLTTDDGLIAALNALGAAGRRAYRAATNQPDEFDSILGKHQESLLAFAVASREALQAERVI